ncbi:hypothetical protein [Christiangramia sp.]|uniref:hypothetical protein n=1 Tax=Christiangramia sp. TaxID=1931228 RepID=UPI002626B0AF|nr:hypothetical protein [Christiangramia sp.]
MVKPQNTLELSFTSLEFYDSIVLSTVKDDIVLNLEHIEELRKICADFFKNEGFVYISNRKNSYTVNPIIYINLIKTNTLKGIAIISENIEKLQIANFEKKFSPVPYELFQNEKEAFVWAQGI